MGPLWPLLPLYRVESFNPQSSLPKNARFLDVGEEKALHAYMQLIQPGGRGVLVWSRPPPLKKKVEKSGRKQMSFIYYNLRSFTLQSEASRNDRCASVFLNQVLYQPSEASSDSFYKRSQLLVSQPSINNMAMSPLTSPPGHGSSDVAG